MTRRDAYFHSKALVIGLFFFAFIVGLALLFVAWPNFMIAVAVLAFAYPVGAMLIGVLKL